MVDPLSPAVMTTGAQLANQDLTQEEMERLLAEEAQQASPEPVAPIAEAKGPELNGVEQEVYENGFDPFAAPKMYYEAWKIARAKVAEAERSVLGVSATGMVQEGLDSALFETGRSVFDITNAVGLTDVDATAQKRSLGEMGATGTVENVGAGIVQFVASFAGYNKALKAAGVGLNSIRWLGAGGLADAFGQDPFADRFSDFVKSLGWSYISDNFVTEYFAAGGNEDDSVFESRFKMAAEGALLGLAIGKPVEAVATRLWDVLSNMKGAYKAAAEGNEKAAQEAFEAAVEAGDDVAKATGQPYFDADKMEWDAGSYYARETVPNVDNGPYSVKTNYPTGDTSMDGVPVSYSGSQAEQLAGVLEQVQIEPQKAGPFRSLAEAAQAMKDDAAARLRAATKVGTEGVPVTPGGQRAPVVPDVEKLSVSTDVLAGDGRPIAQASLGGATAPRYSAFKKAVPPPVEAPPAAAGKGATSPTPKGPKAASGPQNGSAGGVPGQNPRGTGPVIVKATPQAAKEFADNLGKDSVAAIASFEKTFNAGRWNTSDDIREAIGQAADVLRQQGVKVDQKVTAESIKQLADVYLTDPKTLTTRLMLIARNADDMPAVVVATKLAMASLARRLVEVNKQIVKGMREFTDVRALQDTFNRDLSMLQGMLPEFTLVRHRAATTTWTGNMITEDKGLVEGVLNAMRSASGNEGMGRLLLSRLPMNKAAEGINRVLRHKSWDALIQWRTGALLYGPRTHIVNIVSNTAMMGLKPGVRALGAAMMGDGKTAMQNLRTMYYLGSMFQDSWKFMKRAFVEDMGILDPGQNTVELGQKAFQALVDHPQSDAMNLMLRAMDGTSTLPFRALTSMDEFFKQMSYRAYRKAEAVTHARAGLKTGDLKEADFDKWVEDYVKAGFAPDGTATDTVALQYAREATFTEDPGHFANSFQQFVRSNPPMRLIFPFIRTPANLISEGIQMFPGTAPLSKRFRDMIRSGDPQLRAEAVGKFAFGSMVGATVWYYASQGMVTGAAPRDPAQRATFYASGRLPYAIFDPVEKRWVSYNRLDPIAMPVGMFADALNAYYDGDEHLPVAAFAAGVMGIADNLRSKTYLTGLTDMMDLLGAGPSFDEEGGMSRAMRAGGKMIASFVPNLASAINPDDTLRDTRTTMDQIMNRLGVREGIPPRREITGEPLLQSQGWVPFAGETPNFLSPFAYSMPNDDPVKEALFQAQIGIKHPPRKEGNVAYEEFKSASGQNAYDRYLELVGEVKINGKTIKEALAARVPAMIETVKGNIGRQVTEAGEYKSPIEDGVRVIIGHYRRAAKRALMTEFPELYKALLEDKKRASPRARGQAALQPLRQQ